MPSKLVNFTSIELEEDRHGLGVVLVVEEMDGMQVLDIIVHLGFGIVCFIPHILLMKTPSNTVNRSCTQSLFNKTESIIWNTQELRKILTTSLSARANCFSCSS